VLATACLAASAPLILLAAAAIKVHDGGPVLFRQERVGRDGAPFGLLKLRTMVPNAASLLPQLAVVNERNGPLFKMQRDPRVTPVGRVLRVTSLDELPQLLNVLAGSMSLVGPRPALAEEVARFDDELAGRHSVRPGITGLWQIEARHNPSFHAYRRLDLLYTNKWSLALDLSIMVATAPAVLQPVVGAISGSLRRRRAPAWNAPLPVPAPLRVESAARPTSR
ncbi:MAG: sugar transferase, partial [Acidimicrobiales bacterium]